MPSNADPCVSGDEDRLDRLASNTSRVREPAHVRSDMGVRNWVAVYLGSFAVNVQLFAEAQV
jgi:hypothetical protein